MKYPEEEFQYSEGLKFNLCTWSGEAVAKGVSSTLDSIAAGQR